MKFSRKQRKRRGMTLMEVVIAIGVVGFVVPLILAAISSTGISRLNAEADTRSVWIARQVQQEVLAAWAEPPQDSVITGSFAFPSGPGDTTAILLYDREGEFISEGSTQDVQASSKTPGAVYVVRVTAEDHVPPNFTPSAAAPGLAELTIEVLHPATAAPGQRSTYLYRVITPRQGIL